MKRPDRVASVIESLEARQLLSAATLRVVSYNIEADIDGVTTPRSGLTTVLQAIGAESIGGTTRPIDVLALTETTSNSTTVAPIVSALNSVYGAGTYAMSSYQGTEVDADAGDGNGPSALLYNTKTLSLLASVGVGTPEGSSNGEYRQAIRYEFQPVGGPATSDFFLYLSHYKSGSGTTDDTYRGEEAAIIRSDEATLPATARVLYAGDFNDSDTTSPQFRNLTASGQGMAIDPTNTSGAARTEPVNLLTESDTALEYRDDYQVMTSNVLNDSGGGLGYVSGSFEAFGNNGSVPMGGSVDTSSNTALSDLSNRTTVLQDLTTASDHLPVVADYTDPLTTAAATGSIIGTVKAGSTGVGNVTVYLDANNNAKLDGGELSTTTSSTGAYSFTTVPAGTSIVRQELPSGYTQTSPSGGYGIHLTVKAGSTFTNENFTDAASGASIAGTVKVGSTGLAGETIYLDANNNSKLDSGELRTTTTSTGAYSLRGVPAGSYIIRQVLPSGDTQTSPGDNYGIHVTVSSTSSLANENFTDAGTATASISGTVFNDANGNGKQDSGEAGIDGWTVYLDLNNTGAFATGDSTETTNASGDYTIDDLSAGTYIVRVERPSTYKQTAPSNNYGQHVTVAAGKTATGASFGEEKIS